MYVHQYFLHHNLQCKQLTFTPLTIFPGVSLLYQGQVQEAETYLQMAVRWAQTPLEHAVTLNNAGKRSLLNYMCIVLCVSYILKIVVFVMLVWYIVYGVWFMNDGVWCIVLGDMPPMLAYMHNT
ncbi:hypothetical protein EON65_51180 [archaeon]|nr:MAG: hypothetical protein EON65_51180 [archaeon]